MSKKQTETPSDKTPEHDEPATEQNSIIQPIIDDLKANAPPELPIDDVTPPPRGPLHPPQPTGDNE